ncbi:YqgE/AlgH family protein [Roseibacterium sp. SDUM158016]|jgi:putative transcriptional regulator|uniref:YqgE/AlgH family protein n=1 Tax=Roseicyclus sediminis TaxID=2980997 RepID=UPI0021D12881|nr:YqgE/AlgH family protein [Roseibacterium sp. SDUM158016]MCU4651349.1 YqgE/AlgH family protein [Roseibacterium sp. SDUM158016]
MTAATVPENLTGKLLIAMPAMGDARFAGSVVFLCAHSPEGAMGLIVNKRVDEVTFAEMLDQLEIENPGAVRDVPVCYGGPVELRRGFVLHSSDYQARGEDGLVVDGRFSMTATLDVLEDIAQERGPRQALLALGYSGWGPGQLEAEIAQNGWLTAEAAPELVFGASMEGKWEAALKSLGVHPLMLSSEAGHA